MSQENNFIPSQNGYKPLTPFKLFVKSNFPFIEATYEALDNYGLYCKIVEYLNNVIENENTVESNVAALYDAFVSLNNYVSNYFDNLDVQNEINKKLDKMAENGQLQEMVNDIFTELHDNIKTLNNKINSVESGSPAGVYETVEDLETADPNHSKIYLISSTGHWYYFNTTDNEWTDGGLYQAPVDSDSVELLNTIVDNLSDYKKKNLIVPHIGYYIIINNEAQNPKGTEIDADNIQFACSDYIEIPEGTERVITNCNEGYNYSIRCGWATYDENHSCLNTGTLLDEFDITDAKYIRFSNYDADGQHDNLFVTFTIKKLGDTVYMLNNYVTPQMYGAIGDGITDDTRAFQAALDSGYDIYVPCNKGETYRITDTLIMNEIFTFHKLFGDCNPNQNFNNEGIIFENLLSNRNKPLFDIRCSGVHLYGLSFNSKSFSTYWNKTFITTENFEQADKDINIENCYINGFRTAVKFNGRGIQFKQCLLGGIYKLIEASWIATGQTGQQGDDYGMRAIEISNNRIHNVKILVDLLSGNAEGMRICNNMCDNGLCQVVNSISDVDNISIVDNYFLNVHSESTGAVIDFSNNDIKNSIISNNHFVYDSVLLESGMTECEKFMSVDEFYNSQLVNNIIYCASNNIVDANSINKSIISLNNFGEVTTPISYNEIVNSIINNNILTE